MSDTPSRSLDGSVPSENGQHRYFRVSTDENDVVTASLNVPDRPMNVLTEDVMQELSRIVQRVAQAKGLRAFVIRSHKESGFLAGADVTAIRDIDCPQHASALVLAGQQLFQRISRLSVPTIAVIHGPCLGGGLELAMACDFRVARDNSSTKLGLPEIKLGLIPGWGGTQRLPRLVGLRQGLRMILQGKLIDARQAFRMGLIHEAIRPETWDQDVSVFVQRVIRGEMSSDQHKRSRGWSDWFWDQTKLGRHLVMMATRKQTRAQRRHYPAIQAAMKAVAAGFDKGSDGESIELHQFKGLVGSPTSKHLIGLFFAREQARRAETWTRGIQVRNQDPIRTIGVVGAGAMGGGIAQLAAVRGYHVRVMEVDDAALARGTQQIQFHMSELAHRKRWSGAQLEETMSRIRYATSYDIFRDADLVVEAVVERMEVKRSVFDALASVVRPNTILATNTSSLAVDEVARKLANKNRFAGLHFFNPVHRMELVEVVRGGETDPETVARLVELVRALGKTPIVTADGPGFLVNRVLFPYLGEAIRLVRQGVSTIEIDRAAKRFGMPMGPLELLDQVGLDVALHVARSLKASMGESADVVDFLSVMCEHDHLGKKTGQGFYSYRRGKRATAVAQRSVLRKEDRNESSIGFQNSGYVDDGLSYLQRRLLYPMLTEASQCLEDGIVTEPWMVDLAMVMGTGFAPHTGGPLHLIDSIGSDAVLTNLNCLAVESGARFSAPRGLSQHGRLNSSLYFPEESKETADEPFVEN